MTKAELEQRCAELEAELDRVKAQALEDLEAANAEAIARRRQINALKGQLAQRERAEAKDADVKDVLDYYRTKVAPRARLPLTGKAADKVRARLGDGFKVDELKRAIDGCAASPFHMGENDKQRRYCDLGKHICASDSSVREFMEEASAQERREATAREEGRRRDQDRRVEATARVAEVDTGPLERARLKMTSRVAARLGELRGWNPAVVKKLGLGFDGERVVFPIRDREGRTVGALRYAPNPEKRRGPKTIAVKGTPRELFPPPEVECPKGRVWLVEGEPDAVSMWSVGLPAVGVPGVASWKPEWAARFQGRSVIVCLDCDEQGRETARRIERDLKGRTAEVRVVDLDPGRGDGFDVGDLVRETGEKAYPILKALAEQARPEPTVPPLERVMEALERADCRPKRSGSDWDCRCPAHEDRVASLRVGEGRDGRVLLHCHAGCEPEDVVRALGLELRELFTQD